MWANALSSTCMVGVRIQTGSARTPIRSVTWLPEEERVELRLAATGSGSRRSLPVCGLCTCPGPGTVYLGRAFESPELAFVRSLSRYTDQVSPTSPRTSPEGLP
jgi:hypothetical protein